MKFFLSLASRLRILISEWTLDWTVSNLIIERVQCDGNVSIVAGCWLVCGIGLQRRQLIVIGYSTVFLSTGLTNWLDSVPHYCLVSLEIKVSTRSGMSPLCDWTVKRGRVDHVIYYQCLFYPLADLIVHLFAGAVSSVWLSIRSITMYFSIEKVSYNLVWSLWIWEWCFDLQSCPLLPPTPPSWEEDNNQQ